MTELVSDCPRCGAQQITFNVLSGAPVEVRHGGGGTICKYEVSCICKRCNRTTVFIVRDVDVNASQYIKVNGIENINDALNHYISIVGHVSLKDSVGAAPPEHLPQDIEAIYREGATCLAVGCFNAAATMFRLCVDVATKAMLPDGDENGLNAKVRRNLGLRLPWLIENQYLPEALLELTNCIKDDGNEGAHAGTLGEIDAKDLLDFSVILLERIYTEPKRLELAKIRRKQRHDPPK